MNTWLEDANGNKCSVEHFGTKEKAQEALNSLRDCKKCINCSDCFSCFRCFGCFRCFSCFRCSGCYGCSGCSGCYRCSGCSGCYRCSGCSRCSRCFGVKSKKKNTDTFKVPLIPVIPDIHKRVYEAASQPKSLEMSDWHTCEKTHCRGGWVVTLAGHEGKELEEFYGTALVAMLIYDASDPNYKINPSRFFDSNEDALADMKKLAGA